MAWNGTGTYVLSATYSPEVNGTIIDAVRYNGLMTDIQGALNNALCKDGQNAVEANISMGGYKLTSLAAATVAGDAARFEQVLRNGTAGLMAAATTELGASAVSTLSITGTTTITSFGTTAETGQIKWLVFASATPVTHNVTSMILPGGASLTMAVGDVVAVVHLGSGNWKWLTYLPSALVIPFTDGTVSAPSVKFAADPDTGIYRRGANNLGITAGGTNIVDVTTSGAVVTGELRVSGELTAGSFSPSSLTVTGSFTTASTVGNAVNITTASYLSGENADPSNITIAAGSASGTFRNGGDLTLSAGYAFYPGNVLLYTPTTAVSNSSSGSVSISTGDAPESSGALSLATGASTSASTGGISLTTGTTSYSLGRAGDINLTTGIDGASYPEATGAINLKNSSYTILSVEHGQVTLSGGEELVSWVVTSAGSGASVAGGRSRFKVTCGTGASASFTVQDDVGNFAQNRPFYYFSGAVAAPKPMYGGFTDVNGIFTIVLPIAPSNTDEIYVYCLG